MPIIPAASAICSSAASCRSGGAPPDPFRPSWRPAMWRNYLTGGVRALLKSRAYAFINVVGLASGLAACLIILTFVRYEFSYDAWLPNAENTYQFQMIYHPTPTGGLAGESQATSIASAAALKKDFPQVGRAAWTSSLTPIFMQNGVPSTAKKSYVNEGPLLDILRIPFVHDDPKTALDAPHALVLSETEARARIGEGNPDGKTINDDAAGKPTDY